MEFNKIRLILVITIFTPFLTSCGRSTVRSPGSGDELGVDGYGQYVDPNFGVDPPVIGGTGGGDGGTDGGTDGSDDGGDDTSEMNPPLEFETRAVGYTSVSFTVSTGDVLKVQFAPGVQDEVAPGTGFFANYSQMGVYIKVNGNEKPTALLSNGLVRAAETSSIIDMSGSLGTSCTGDPLCRQTVTVTVTKPNYDYWCYSVGDCRYTHTHVYQNHPWNGFLYVETNDTQPLTD